MVSNAALRSKSARMEISFCQLHRGGRYEPLTKQFLYYGTLCKQIGDYLKGCTLRDDL